MKHELARMYAEEVVELLRPACLHIEIAGSLRRQKEEVKDIEIVCCRAEAGLFADEQGGEDFDTLIQKGIDNGLLLFDLQVKRNGPKYKRFIVSPSKEIALDLFIPEVVTYGNILAIRTGCAEYSKALMWRAKQLGMHQKDGYLVDAEGVVACCTEADYFGALQLPWLAPEKRTEEAAQKIYGRR